MSPLRHSQHFFFLSILISSLFEFSVESGTDIGYMSLSQKVRLATGLALCARRRQTFSADDFVLSAGGLAKRMMAIIHTFRYIALTFLPSMAQLELNTYRKPFVPLVRATDLTNIERAREKH